MALTVDQSQLTGSAGVGFGEFANVRYRVQGFIPSVTRIDAVGFYFNGNKGSKGLRVELQTIVGGIPSGTVLAFGQLTNAQLDATLENVIPLVYSGLSTSTAYALVLMPWDTTNNVYADDYRDMVHVIANAYTPSSYWKYESGAYSTESIDFKFSTYYDPAAGSPDVTITPAAQGLTLGLQSPTVSTSGNRTVTPATQTAVLSQPLPSVSATGAQGTYLLDGFEHGTARWQNGGTGSIAFDTGYTSPTGMTLTTPTGGDVNAYRTLWSALLQGFDTLSFDVNFHGNTFLTAGDTPALVIEQTGWKYVLLHNFATNGADGWQHVTIPLSKFTANGDATATTSGTGTSLDPAAIVTALRVRIYESTGGKTLSLDNLLLTDSTGTLHEDFTQSTLFTDATTKPWRVQSGDVMKWSKDDLMGQHTDSQLAAVASRIASLNATHLAYATPYDAPADYPGATKPVAGYNLRWVSAARAHGLNVFHRRSWLAWEGIYGVTKNTTLGLGQAATVLDGTDTTSFLYKTYKFWLDNAGTLVEAGDIVCPTPEPENGGITGINGSAPYQFPDADTFRVWLRDAITVVNAALDAHSLKGQVFVGLYGTSGFITFGNGDNPHGFLDDRTAEAMGVIGMDNYPSPASNMGADLDKARAIYDLPLFLSEWGTINEATDSDRIAAMNSVASAMTARAWIQGLNYWTTIGGSNEDVLDAATISPIAAYYALQTAFGGSTDLTFNPASQQLTLAPQTPTVTSSTTPAPASLSLTLSPQAPTISAGKNSSPAPIAQTATLSQPTPTLTTTRAVTVTPVMQNLATSVPLPTISASGTATTAPSVQSLTAIPLTSTVSAQKQASPSTATQSLSLSQPAPTLSTTRTVNPHAGVATLGLSVLTPVINAGRAVLTLATTMQATISALAASVHIAPSGTVERILIDENYALLVDEAGDYVVVDGASHTPLTIPKDPLKTPGSALITHNASLVSKARHVLTSSDGSTVIARSSGKDVFTRGGTEPLTTPKPPLVSR